MKKVVIFGGGSGLSQILKGLRLFPIDVTAVVTVSDNGTSTGRLKKDYNIPAVGDLSKVLISMADCDNDIKDLMNYRFLKSKTLGNHSIKNLLLTALLDMKGDFSHALPILSKLLNVKGNVLPLTEDNVDLIAYTKDGKTLVGEEQITKSKKIKERLDYSREITVNPDVLNAVKKADLIIFSSGSLVTSIIPHLLNDKLNNAIRKSKAKKMYICNLFTQPGETDDFKVSDHILLLEKYLGKNTIDIVIANNNKMNSYLVHKYQKKEQKDQVIFDIDKLREMNKIIIADKLYLIEDNVYRHDSLKTAYLVFSYLMDGAKNDVHN